MDINQIPIIPIEQTFYNKNSNKLINWEPHSQYELDLSAISSFIALGFMLEDSTYFTDIKVLQPSTKYTIDTTKNIQNLQQTWQWHYNPSDRSFDEILEEFSALFEKLIINNIKNRSILLPISGGLDSRTLFVPLKNKSKLTLCSYEFEDGVSELETGKRISERFKIPFYSEKIQRGYLWDKLDEFHQLNKCFTDFTHPRQVATINHWKGLGDVILLGHWGDVLFDKQADSYDISYDEQIMQLKKKIMVPGGVERATDLWKHWGLEGSFETNITDRLDSLYRKINIDHPSARIRAFKSLYWAPRYTSINLSIYNKGWTETLYDYRLFSESNDSILYGEVLLDANSISNYTLDLSEYSFSDSILYTFKLNPENDVYSAQEINFYFQNILNGDINIDGQIDILDIILVVGIILNDYDYNSNADMNQDGNIDLLDIITIINIILSS